MPSLPIFERLLHGVLLCTSSKFADFLKSKATLETEMKTSSLPVLFPETVNWHDWCFGASRWYTNRWSFRETARGLSCLNGYFVFRESVEIRQKGSMSDSSWVSWTWFGALEGRYRQMHTRNLVWHVWQEQHWGYFCVELNSIQARHPAPGERTFLRFGFSVSPQRCGISWNIYQQIIAKYSKYPIQMQWQVDELMRVSWLLWRGVSGTWQVWFWDCRTAESLASLAAGRGAEMVRTHRGTEEAGETKKGETWTKYIQITWQIGYEWSVSEH